MLTRLRDPEASAALVECLLSSGIAVAFEARGTSMEPAIHQGDRVVIRATRRFGAGDIVMARHENALVVHRVIRRTHDGFVITRGDATRRDDPPVAPESILGVVTHATRGGRQVDVRESMRVRVVRYLRVARRTLRALRR